MITLLKIYVGYIIPHILHYYWLWLGNNVLVTFVTHDKPFGTKGLRATSETTTSGKFRTDTWSPLARSRTAKRCRCSRQASRHAAKSVLLRFDPFALLAVGSGRSRRSGTHRLTTPCLRVHARSKCLLLREIRAVTPIFGR